MRLALGTVQFGLYYGIANTNGQVSGPEAARMLCLASSSGIDVLDTAISYGDSECKLGETGVSDFRIITKLPAIPEGCHDVAEWIFGQVAGSIARLRVQSLYGLLLHQPQQLLEKNGAVIYASLHKLKQVGLVQKIGVSIYDPTQLESLCANYVIDLVQAPFNLVDRRLLTSGWLQRLTDEGVEVHVRSVFLQGLLLLPLVDIPVKFSSWAPLWHQWRDWLAQSGVTAVQACLAYALSFPAIDRVVVGADSEQQLQQIINAAGCQLPSELPNLECYDEALISPALWGVV